MYKRQDITNRLQGQNYVLWGGREGYETILNTNIEIEMDNLARFLELVVNYKHKVGFKGQILLEPKPHEPTKHQYDFDTASCLALIRKAGLEKEIKLNIEVNDVKDPNALVPQQLKVETRDGRFYAKSTSEVYGSPSAPMSDDEQFKKFSGCLDFSGIQGMNDRRSQWEKWFDFHKLDSVHELITEFRIT